MSPKLTALMQLSNMQNIKKAISFQQKLMPRFFRL